MDYKASLDTVCKVMTAGVFVLFIAIGQMSFRAIISANGDLTSILVHGSVLVSFVAIIVISYLFSTSKYTVTTNELIIHRPISDRAILIADIKEIRSVDPKDFSGTIRTFGNGGLFGYYGKFYNSKIGNMTWYVTQNKNSILIRTQQGDKIMISPDDISLIDKVQTGMMPKQ